MYVYNQRSHQKSDWVFYLFRQLTAATLNLHHEPKECHFQEDLQGQVGEWVLVIDVPTWYLQKQSCCTHCSITCALTNICVHLRPGVIQTIKANKKNLMSIVKKQIWTQCEVQKHMTPCSHIHINNINNAAVHWLWTGWCQAQINWIGVRSCACNPVGTFYPLPSFW